MAPGSAGFRAQTTSLGFSFSFSCNFTTLSSSMLTLEKAMAPHSSILAWEIPWAEETGRLQSMGSLGVRHDWTTSLSLFTFMHWRRKWQPTPVFLPGESQGQGSLVGCRLWGHTEFWTRLKWLSSSMLTLNTGSDQIRSVAQSCPTLCNPMNHSTPGLGTNGIKILAANSVLTSSGGLGPTRNIESTFSTFVLIDLI